MASGGLTQQQRLEQWQAWMNHVPRAKRRETDRRRLARVFTQTACALQAARGQVQRSLSRGR
jgi:hypothetical protein